AFWADKITSVNNPTSNFGLD
ncbi:unnamed protein product, partial [Allacma fusca]